MANEQNAGLELDVGLTDRKIRQQAARVVADMEKQFRKGEATAVKVNSGITKSFTNMSRQSRAQIQNVSYQLQDVFTQIAGGQGAARALGQQLPQLLGGFGALGAVLGVVAGAAIPLAANFLGAGDAAENLGDSIDNLQSAVKDYQDSVAAATAPTEDLIEKYGRASESAQELLGHLARLQRLEAATQLQTSVSKVEGSFGDLVEHLRLIDAEIAQGAQAGTSFRIIAEEIEAQFGLTVDQARRLQQLVTDAGNARSLSEQSAALEAMARFFDDAVRSGAQLPPEIQAVAKEIAKGTLSTYELVKAIEDAESHAVFLSDAVASIDWSNPIAGAQQLSGVMGGLIRQAQGLLDRLGAAAQAARQRIQNAVSSGNELDPLGVFNGGQSSAFAVQVNAGGTIRTPVVPDPAKTGTGGRSGRSGGSGRAAATKEAFDYMEAIEREIETVQREISVLGKSTAEIAEQEAKWTALDAAKREGITVTDEMNAKIDAQAAEVGRLTAELERAEIAQQQFDEAIDGIADAMAGALVAGESLRDGLAQVFKQIAADILNSGIRNLLTNLIPGIGGDPLTSALRAAGLNAGFAAGGYTGPGSKYEPAGVVHKGEYVFSKRAVDRMGAENLDALHRAGMAGYASGGLVGDFVPTAENGPELIIERNAV